MYAGLQPTKPWFCCPAWQRRGAPAVVPLFAGLQSIGLGSVAQRGSGGVPLLSVLSLLLMVVFSWAKKGLDAASRCFLRDCSRPNPVLLPSAGAQYGSGVTPPAAVPLFAIDGCICLGKECFGCGATPPTKPWFCCLARERSMGAASRC